MCDESILLVVKGLERAEHDESHESEEAVAEEAGALIGFKICVASLSQTSDALKHY